MPRAKTTNKTTVATRKKKVLKLNPEQRIRDAANSLTRRNIQGVVLIGLDKYTEQFISDYMRASLYNEIAFHDENIDKCNHMNRIMARFTRSLFRTRYVNGDDIRDGCWGDVLVVGTEDFLETLPVSITGFYDEIVVLEKF